MPLFSSRAHASKKAGFTLIELIVVLAILAILSAAGFAVYQ
jgi:prepilin-type N-terminal cleavage/methylation domain-containing protein